MSNVCARFLTFGVSMSQAENWSREKINKSNSAFLRMGYYYVFMGFIQNCVDRPYIFYKASVLLPLLQFTPAMPSFKIVVWSRN